MRTLNAQEMDAASGGVVPLIGLVAAVAGLFVKGGATAKAITITGVAIGGVSAGAYGYGLIRGDLTWDGLSCKP